MSSAFPMARPSGCDISVTHARARRPRCAARPTHASARSRPRAGVFMNAPLPALTSSMIRSVATASFLHITLAAISGMLATVPVASRSA